MKRIVFFCLIGVTALVPIPETLAQPNPQDYERFKNLRQQLLDPNPVVSTQAARQLAAMASLMRGSGTILGTTLESDDPSVRIQAAKAISAMGTMAKGAIVPLIGAIKKEKDDEVLYQLLKALAIVPYTRSKVSIDNALLVVLPFLKHENPKIRWQAASTVGVFREDALAAVPALRKLLDDPTPPPNVGASSVSMNAMGALERIGVKDKETIDALFQITHSKEIEKKTWAMAALARLAPKDKRVFPMLHNSLKQTDNLRLRFAATGCLVLLRTGAREAIPDLIEVLTFDDPNHRQWAKMLRYNAVKALGAIGTAAKAAIPALRRVAASDPDRSVRRRAQKTLANLQKAHDN